MIQEKMQFGTDTIEKAIFFHRFTDFTYPEVYYAGLLITRQKVDDFT